MPRASSMNERDRDRFYGASGDDGDNDADLEVEPPDAEVLAAEARRARELVEASEHAIDINEIYRQTEGRSDLAFSLRPGEFRFQFRIKHLLVAMLVLSLLLTLWRLEALWATLVLTTVTLLVVAFAYKEFQEQRRHLNAQREWDEKYQRRREYFESRNQRPDERTGDAPTIYDDLPFDGAGSAAAPLPSAADLAWQKAMSRERFRFQFSLRQLLLAMTLASVVFGVVHLIGPGVAATLLGFVVLGGLVLHALGADPPHSVIMAWWLLLFLYVAMSLVAVVNLAL